MRKCALEAALATMMHFSTGPRLTTPTSRQGGSDAASSSGENNT